MTEGGERQLPAGAKAEAEEAFVNAIAAAFRGRHCGGAGQGELEGSSSDPELYLYDRGMTVIHPSVTVADANARTCSFEHPPG